MNQAEKGLCPLCEQANECAIAAGGKIEDCWCATYAMSAQALDRLSPGERGARCLCARCGRPVAEEKIIEG